ncbi:MAG: RidA family protein [Dermatophilaceae bacterium]
MTLPTPPTPQGRYVPALEAGPLILTAGMTPRVEGVLQSVGKVGREVSTGDARAAARIAASNAIAAAAQVAGSLDVIRRAVRMTVYVNAVEDFAEHSAVADGASEVLAEVLGERGAVVRTAVGVASLPGGACVEIELTFLR